MAKEMWEVAKFNKRTGKKTKIMVGTWSKVDTTRLAGDHNKKRTPEEGDEIEFRCCPGDASFRTSFV